MNYMYTLDKLSRIETIRVGNIIISVEMTQEKYIACKDILEHLTEEGVNEDVKGKCKEKRV